MKVFRWTSGSITKEYEINIPLFNDDTNGVVITKIALDIHRQDPTADISKIPYVWANKDRHSVGFNLGSFRAPLNPWDTDIPKAPERYTLISLSDVIWTPHNTLNIVFVNDVPETIKAHPAYFPIKTKISDTYDKISKEAVALKTVWDAQADAQTYGIQYRKITFIGSVQHIDMIDLIKRLKTSAKPAVPFNQFVVDDTKILYKVNKKHNLSTAMMKQLVAFDRVPKLQGIVAIIPMNKHNRERHVYAKLVMDTAGKLVIFYKIDSKVVVTWQEIRDHNKIIKNWLGESAKLQVSSLSARASLVTKRDYISVAEVSERASKLPAIFHLDKPAFRGSVEIVYKRSVNYKSNLDIVDNIKSQFQMGIPEAEVKENLVSYTGMTMEAAEDWIQQYYSSLENENLDPKKKPKKRFMSTGCIVAITQDKQGLNLNFENLGSLGELNMALRWISGTVGTVTVAAAPVKKPKPTATAPPPLPPPPPLPTPSESSSESDNSYREALNTHVSFDSDGGAAGKDNNGYFLKMLEAADLDVFDVSRVDKRGNKKSYSRLCGVTNFRQPVVVNKVKMESIKAQGYDRAINDSLLYRNNHYFCPAIWCPKAMLPVTLNQLVKVNGKDVCPGEFGEEPIYMYKDEFWSNNPELPRYIGFLDKQLSDKGLCMPCCMKTSLLNNPSAVKKAKLEKCLGSSAVSQSAGPTPTRPPPESNKQHEDHFILGAAAPIPVGRYGTVPVDLHTAVYPGVPYDTCSAALNSSSCIVRYGINHGEDSLLSAIATCLDIEDKNMLISKIKKTLDPITFMSLDKGNVLQSFIYNSEGVVILEKAAQKWFARHNVESMMKGDNNKKRMGLIYAAYTAFVDSLKSSDPKNEDIIIDLIATMGFTLVIINKVGESVQVSCPSRIDGNNSVIALLKDAPYYEPLVIKTKSKKFQSMFRVDQLGNLINIVRSGCGDISNTYTKIMSIARAIKQWIDVMLISHGNLAITKILLRPDLQIHGFLTRANLIINVDGGWPCTFLPGLKEIFNIKEIMFLEDQQSIDVDNIPAHDVGLLSGKLRKLDMHVDMTFLQSPPSPTDIILSGKYVFNQTSIYDSSFPAIRFTTLNRTTPSVQVTYNRYQQIIWKVIIDQYDSLVYPLIGRKDMLQVLVNTFKALPDKDLILKILSTMPLAEGKDTMIRWRRYAMGMAMADIEWASETVHDYENEWVFTQVAVQSGSVPEYIYNPPNGPIAVMQKKTERIIQGTQPTKPKHATPSFLDTTNASQLPSKWRRGSFTYFKVVGNEYTDDSIKQLVKWLSDKTLIPISYQEIDVARRKEAVKRMLTKSDDIQKSVVGDASMFNIMRTGMYPNRAPFKNAVELLAVFNAESSQNRQAVITTFFQTHGDIIWPCDMDLVVLAHFLDISIFSIHSRSTYKSKKEAAKRGDDADRMATSSLMVGSKDWQSRPIIMLYMIKELTSSHASYHAVVDKSGKFYFDSINDLPEDIRNLIETAHASMV